MILPRRCFVALSAGLDGTAVSPRSARASLPAAGQCSTCSASIGRTRRACGWHTSCRRRGMARSEAEARRSVADPAGKAATSGRWTRGNVPSTCCFAAKCRAISTTSRSPGNGLPRSRRWCLSAARFTSLKRPGGRGTFPNWRTTASKVADLATAAKEAREHLPKSADKKITRPLALHAAGGRPSAAGDIQAMVHVLRRLSARLRLVGEEALRRRRQAVGRLRQAASRGDCRAKEQGRGPARR